MTCELGGCGFRETLKQFLFPEEGHDKQDDADGQEDDEKDLGNHRRSSGDSGEAEESCH